MDVLMLLLYSYFTDKMDFVSLGGNHFWMKSVSVSNNVQVLSYTHWLFLLYFILYVFGIFLQSDWKRDYPRYFHFSEEQEVR